MLEEELKTANVDVGAIAEWQRRDTEYRGRLADLEAATQARNQARGAPRCGTWQAASMGIRSDVCTRTGSCWGLVHVAHACKPACACMSGSVQ